MNRFKTLRKLAIFMLVVASVLTLAACNRGDDTPYGDLSDNVYLTLGDITITEKALYNQLRLQGATILATMIDEKLFADELVIVRNLLADGDEDANEYFDDTVNNAIHGTSNKDNLERLFERNPERFYRNIEQYADSLYLLDNALVIADIIDALVDLVNTQDTPYSGYASIPAIVTRYELRVAQRYFAQQKLAEEVLDEESTVFISDENVLAYYRNNRQGRYDVETLVIRFINLNEANAALYKASIKADARGLWYQVPDIRIPVGEPGYIDLNDTISYGHVKTILENLNLLGKLGADYEDRSTISVLDYENYYKAYVISTNRETGLRDVSMTNEEVLEAFVRIYNFLNPASEIEIALDGTIVGVGGADFNTSYTYDELTKLNASLRNHIYNTLAAADSIDPDDPAEGRPFSSRVQTFGNSRYLVFKLSDDSDSEEGILIEDPEDPDLEIFADTEDADAIRQEMYDKIFESRLTNTYITTAVQTLYEDLTVNIYDPIVRAFYEQYYGYEGTTRNRAGDVIADFADYEITVRELYDRLEASYGINLALDQLSNLWLLNSEDYSISETDRDNYEEQFKDIIRQFSADQFATAGYPASMGRDNFLLLAFGVTTNAEAVNQLYIYPELRQQYLQDMNAHYDGDDYSIYEKLADLAAKQHAFFESINVSHLLIYVDENGDGSPDNPAEYLDKLSPEGRDQVLDGLVNLVELLYQRVGNYKGQSEGLRALADEFNATGRIFRGENKIPPYDYTLEQIWAEYRQLGFHLRFESIQSAVTNTSNFITGASVLDEVFYNRAMDIHARLADMVDDESKFPYLDLYSDVITRDALDEVQSSFGWHLILATSVREPVSAIFKESSDEDGRYISDDDERNAYNEDSETLTAGQIEFYLVEKESPEGVVLPSAVQTAVTAYLNPILNRYNNTHMQRELIFKMLEDVEFASADDALRFQTIRDINRRQFFEYMLSTLEVGGEVVGVFDANYFNLYGNWFNILEATERP